jgi:hypothetical protein
MYVKWVHCHHGMARPLVADRGDGLQIWRVAANMLNKQSRTADSGWSSSLRVGRGPTTFTHKTQCLLRNTAHSRRPGRIIWHNLSTIKANEMGGACGTYGRGNCTRFWWENPKERDHSEDQGVGGRKGSEWNLGRLAWGLGIGLDWLRIGTGGGLL